ncbi:MAG: arsenite efflux transporter metallochaperone ArsD [Clostridia bacterium]|nr:arsenite efflux transporter metallochaperone ArsD [Clostridia bacterium]
MKRLSLYEPPMCCPTGLCGVSVDPELLRISTVLSNLKKNGIVVERYNLTSAPQEFVKNQEVNAILSSQGMNALPLTMVDGKIVMTKRYPTNAELSELLEIDQGVLAQESKPSARYKVTSHKGGPGLKGGCS